MGRREEAFAWANRALQANPDDPDALVIRGRYLWKERRRPDLGLEELKQAAQLDPERYQDLYQQGRMLVLRERALDRMGKGDFARAFEDANQVLAADPRSAEGHLVRGTALLEAGRVEETIKDMTLALKADPRLSWALFQRAVALEMLGQRGRALADFKRAAVLDPARFQPMVDKLLRAQAEGSPPLWRREAKVRLLARPD
ncbi:MAG: hypothetical protein HY552_04155 [Elusimicrobia bacterium]|nr:hypothetical protein [Elusimicrobiota bacterium]